MNNYIAKFKQNIGNDGKRTAMILLGFVSGAALSKAMDMLSEKYPDYESWVTYSKPILLGGGGILISTLTDKESDAKYFGYGLATAGAFEGIKLIPIAKEYLSGIDDNNALTYYTESDKPLLGLNKNALPVKSISIQEASAMGDVYLPELEGTGSNGSNSDLGYNNSFNELGYNRSVTEEDLGGII